jgi:hypothetical protein
VGNEAQQRSVELVDVNGIYAEPDLDCGDERPFIDRNLPVSSPVASQVAATTDALRGWGVTTEFDIEPLRGYPEARFTEHVVEPTVEVVQGGDTVAFAQLRGAADRGDQPRSSSRWQMISILQFCPSLQADQSPEEGGGSTGT